jgi:hypothetical protein
LAELHYILYEDEISYDVIIVTETWLNCTVTNAMLDPGNKYTIFRADRNAKYDGGGVCVFISSDFKAASVDSSSFSPAFEYICVDLFGKAKSKLRMVLIYRPGGMSVVDLLSMVNLTDCLKQLCTLDTTCLIVGDLNCPNIDWANAGVLQDKSQKVFFDSVCDLGFQQYVVEPTRESNILDLILCNDPLLVIDVFVKTPFSTSDHSMVQFSLNILELFDVRQELRSNKNADVSSQTNCGGSPILSRNWFKADWVSMNSFLSEISWNWALSLGNSADDYWNYFIEVLHFVTLQFVPAKSVPKGRSKKKLSTYSPKVKKLLSKKNILWRKYKAKRTKKRKENFNLLAKKCKDLLDSNATEKERNILKSSDLGKFYRFVNSKLSSKSGVGPLKNKDGGYALNAKEKADLLNDYFGSVCITDNNKFPDFPSRVLPGVKLDSITFSQRAVYKILVKLKPSLAGGPDKLPPLFFKKLAEVLTSPLTELFNILFSIGELPAIWKYALVTPIFKKGSASKVENYRPISLTCVACKVFETIVKTQLQDYLQRNDLLHKAQHGFLSGHSTCTNLLESLNDWTLNVRNGACTRVAFIDFARAFDSVTHSKLLLKLISYGITGKLIKVMKSFLSGRSQCVAIEGEMSENIIISSGVPQGSVLGPLLFILYINDLVDVLPDKVVSRFFADDAKLYTDVTTGDDVDELQFSIDHLTSWASTWQLGISFMKCSTIDLGNKNKVDTFCENSIEGNCLEGCNEIIDLGVKLDSSLTFTPHINQIVSKARQRIFLLFRAFRTRDTKLMLLGYKSYILPLFDYCSQIWSPRQLSNISALESVQRLFTRRLPDLKGMAYAERLNVLNIPSLELRRLRADLIFCYKILHGQVAGSPENYGLTILNGSTRGHDMKLYHEHARVDARRNFFSFRISDAWNSLPYDVVHSHSVVAFKYSLRKCNLTRFLLQDFDSFNA